MFGIKESFAIKWEIDDIIHIESQWSQTVGFSFYPVKIPLYFLVLYSCANQFVGLCDWFQIQTCLVTLRLRPVDVLGVDNVCSTSGVWFSNKLSASFFFIFVGSLTHQTLIGTLQIMWTFLHFLSTCLEFYQICSNFSSGFFCNDCQSQSSKGSCDQEMSLQQTRFIQALLTCFSLCKRKQMANCNALNARRLQVVNKRHLVWQVHPHSHLQHDKWKKKQVCFFYEFL